jgi:histidyl-tRNA synthetase
VLRFPVPQSKGYTAHFNLFALVTAGRDTGSFSMELASLLEHVEVYLRLLSLLNSQGFSLQNVEIEISDTRVISYLCNRFGISVDDIRREVRARDSQSSERLLQRHNADWAKNPASPGDALLEIGLAQHLVTQMELMVAHVMAPLKRNHAGLEIGFNLRRLTGLGYYDGPCFHIKVSNSSGEKFMLADGGFVDWTRRILADKKERLLTSAIGIELLARAFL